MTKIWNIKRTSNVAYAGVKQEGEVHEDVSRDVKKVKFWSDFDLASFYSC